MARRLFFYFYNTAALFSAFLLLCVLVYWPLSYRWELGSGYTDSNYKLYRIGCVPGRTFALVMQPIGASGFYSYATRSSDGAFEAWSYLTWRTNRSDPRAHDVTTLGVTWDDDGDLAFLLVPFSYLAILFSILPLLALRALRRRRKAARVGLCPKCGYDLRAHGAGQVCPECGTVIHR